MSEDYGLEPLPKRKRKPTKRYLASDDEGEEPSPVPAKAPRRNSSTRPRRKSIAAEDTGFRADETADEDMNIDVEGMDDEDEELLAAASVGTSQSQSHSKSSKGKGSARGKTPANGPSRKKSRNVVVSDEEEDYLAEEAVLESDEDRVDEDYYSEEEKPKKGKSKASGGGRGTKRKANGEPESLSARPALERKLSVDTRKKSKASIKADESLQSLLDFGESVPTPDASEMLSSPVAPTQSLDSPVPTPVVAAPPKKLKLPTIKKTKLPGAPSASSGPATGGTSTPTSATPKTKLPLDLGIGSNRKAHNATTDLDLSNKSIYQELFKTSTDGGTPRTGLNRRSKEEERRKELNKQKEDYLAKQAEEALRSFDLQAPTDRISQFEDRLRMIKSGALYPQWLAGKWKVVYEREQYEKERRKQKEQAQALIPVPGSAPNGSSQEEGEVK